MRVLHVPDLYFGLKTETGRMEKEGENREYFIQDLKKGLEKIAKRNPIDYMFITGDIVDTESKEAYEEAGKWLQEIAGACKIPAKRICLCPEEHTEENEELLREYEYFCRSMGVLVYESTDRMRQGYIREKEAADRGKRYRHSFCIYELNKGKEAEEDCIRTIYAFNGQGWCRQSEHIKLEAAEAKEKKAEKPLKHSFHILWWTRI